MCMERTASTALASSFSKMLTAYQHEELPSPLSIRLIHLAAGNAEDALRCRIETTTLENTAPVYEAVSYIWGTEECKPIIRVNTELGDRQLEITQNLALALRRFRRPSSARALWVDSVCINQSDEKEKAIQVLLMGEIYSRASIALVWLGEGSDAQESSRIGACIEQMSIACPKIDELEDQKFKGLGPNNSEWNGFLGLRRRDADEIHQSLGIPLLHSPELQALVDFLRNQWFFRAWTWQESFLAKEAVLHLGSKAWTKESVRLACLSISKLREVTGLVHEYGGRPTSAMQMLTGQVFWKSNKEFLKLCHLLHFRRGSGCKYPSDLVYSLLGAAWDRPNIQVDYSKPFEIVYAISTWQIMSQQRDLSMLRYLERNRRSSDLPTWAPDWRVEVRNGRDLSSLVASTFKYRATGSSRLIARLSGDCKILSASGIYWDVISAVHPSDDAKGLEQWVGAQFDCPEQLQKLYLPTKESLKRALRRVWYIDTTAFVDGDEERRWQSNSHATFEDIEKNALSEGEGRIKYGKLLHSLVEVRDRRAIFITEGGQLGMAANTIQPGDVIAMLLGGDVPLVLRPKKKAGEYTIAADCYVHGFMDGEALVDARKSADPAWRAEEDDHGAWLEELHEGDLPFPVQEFHLY